MFEQQGRKEGGTGGIMNLSPVHTSSSPGGTSRYGRVLRISYVLSTRSPAIKVDT